MSESSATIESKVPLFDVYVERPSHLSVDDLNVDALQHSGLSPDHVRALLESLRKSPRVKVGSAVTHERCESAKEKFALTGLDVFVKPVLSLRVKEAGAFDGRYLCPNCGERVELPENRQCPSCKVFVDKVDEAFLLRKKIMQQERAKLDYMASKQSKDIEAQAKKSLEDEIRAKVRKELEAEFGIDAQPSGLFTGKLGVMRAVGLLGLLGVSFVSGQSLPALDLPWRKADAVAPANTSGAQVDKLLSQGLAANDAGAPAGGAALPAGTTGDPDIDNDPMMQAIGGNRMGAKGLSMEQALGAATVLARSVGNTTADRAMANVGGGAGGAGMGSAGGVGSASTGVGAARSPVVVVDAASIVPVSVPAALKNTLKAEFASTLAEVGQLPRARSVLKALKADATAMADPQVATAVALADLDIQAWALQHQPAGQALTAANALKAQAQALPDVALRAQALSRLGVVFSQQASLSPDVAHAFLTLAAAALKTVPDPKVQAPLVGPWMVSMGQVLLAEVTAHARAARWQQAQKSVDALQAITSQASEPAAQVPLQALVFAAKNVLGQADLANPHLADALRLANEPRELATRAANLRALSRLAGPAAAPQVQAAANALLAQLEPAVGPDKARALTQLALMQADQGAQGPSERMSQLAETTTGLTPTEMLVIKADLVVRRSLALAHAHQQAQAYAQLEVVLQTVSDHLF